mgnify:CR=1 FL=1
MPFFFAAFYQNDWPYSHIRPLKVYSSILPKTSHRLFQPLSDLCPYPINRRLKVLNVIWITTLDVTIGIVTTKNESGEIKTRIKSVRGMNEESDIKNNTIKIAVGFTF